MAALLTAARMLAEGNHEGALERARSVTGGAYHAKALMLEAQVLALKGAPAEQTEAALKKAADAGDKTAAFYLAYTRKDSTDADLAKAGEGLSNWYLARHCMMFNLAPEITPPQKGEEEQMRREVAEHIAHLEKQDADAEKARLEAERAAAEKARLEAERAAAEKARREAEAKAAAEKARKAAEAKAAAEKARKEAEERARLAAEAANKPNIPFLVLMWVFYAILEILLFCQINKVEASMAFNRYTVMTLLALSVIPVLAVIDDKGNGKKAVSSSGLGKFSLLLCAGLLFVMHLQTFHIIFVGEPLNTFLILGVFAILGAVLIFGYQFFMDVIFDAWETHGQTCASIIVSSIVCCAAYMLVLSFFGTPWDAFAQVLNLIFS